MRPTTDRYAIHHPDGKVLIDLYNGKARWSSDPADAMTTGFCWILPETAAHKMREVRKCLDIPLSLKSHTFRKNSLGQWRLKTIVYLH